MSKQKKKQKKHTTKETSCSNHKSQQKLNYDLQRIVQIDGRIFYEQCHPKARPRWIFKVFISNLFFYISHMRFHLSLSGSYLFRLKWKKNEQRNQTTFIIHEDTLKNHIQLHYYSADTAMSVAIRMVAVADLAFWQCAHDHLSAQYICRHYKDWMKHFHSTAIRKFVVSRVPVDAQKPWKLDHFLQNFFRFSNFIELM